MSNRIAGLTITAIWLVLMALLVRDDVIPYWYAQEPPADRIPRSKHQVAIFNAAGDRVGTSWVRTVPTGDFKTVLGSTIIDMQRVSNILPVRGMLRLESNLTYNSEDELDDFLFMMDASGMIAKVHGERYNEEFACLAEFGQFKRQLALDARMSSFISDGMRPFTHLSGLEVGHTWRLNLLEPMALLTEREVRFRIQLVRVTARETIEHHGEDVECFRIETEQTVAWADDDGRIIRQEVTIPLLGKWTMIDEPYDDDARRSGNPRPYSNDNDAPAETGAVDNALKAVRSLMKNAAPAPAKE